MKKPAAALGTIAATTALVAALDAPAALAGGDQTTCQGVTSCQLFTLQSAPGGRIDVYVDVIGRNHTSDWSLYDGSGHVKCGSTFKVVDPPRHWTCNGTAKGRPQLWVDGGSPSEGFKFSLRLHW